MTIIFVFSFPKSQNSNEEEKNSITAKKKSHFVNVKSNLKRTGGAP